MLRRLVAGMALSFGMLVSAADPQLIVLRPDLPAGEEWYTPESTNQHVKSPTEKWLRKVARPVMEVYPAARPNGTAVVVAPGGGFTILAIEHEGRDVAKWMNERGVTAVNSASSVCTPGRQIQGSPQSRNRTQQISANLFARELSEGTKPDDRTAGGNE